MYKTFDAFRPHFNALARVGYFKILKPMTLNKPYLHKVYRTVVWILVITYNLQHLFRVIQVRHSTEEMVNTLFILLTTLNTLGKQVAFNFRTGRVDRILATINGFVFAPRNKHHEDVLKSNAASMQRLLKLYLCAIFICGGLWTIFPIVNRVLGEDVQFTCYFPFNTSNSPVFELTLAYMSILITFQAYGNVTMDCTIVAFYAQAKTQLQILRFNLEHLADLDGKKKNGDFFELGTYKDVANKGFNRLMHRRFVSCVKHHQQIVWFAKEVESIFGEAMVIQCFVMTWVICMTVYKIVGLSIFSVEFFSMGMYLGCMLAQLFIYCYYGTQLKVESNFLNQSIYSSEWTSLSPAMRRQLLLLMTRCSRPISPCIAYIIPMSTETYITIIKSSYTLFTFLNRK
ncbi:unnamed protein product [Parnassius mnemosyne]|uniref:Odorant receptor n=1 Tax=Parnassius mnemosyne TaxID=213953 RepID=A0AAV1MC32_9NEOP